MSPTLSVCCPGTFQALGLVNADQSGYIACALIGQKRVLSDHPFFVQSKSPSGLSKYNFTKAQINSCTTVPSKVCAPQVLMKML